MKKGWSEEEYALEEHGGKEGRMCFGMMWDNGVVKPFPPMKRAMEITRDALVAAGHKGFCVILCAGALLTVLLFI